MRDACPSLPAPTRTLRKPHAVVNMSKSQKHMMATKRPVALVTGASSGTGEATALALAEAGFEVIGTSRNTSKVAPSATA